MIAAVQRVVLCLFSVLLSVSTITFAQSITELDRNPAIKLKDLDKISLLNKADSLKPVYYSKDEGYTTDPGEPAASKVYGCTGDFNDDENRDFALVVVNFKQQRGQLVALVTGMEYIFVLQSFEPLEEVAERNPFSILLNAPVCYQKSETGKFTGLEDMKYDMPGDLFNFGWYSWVWNGENGFKEIVTSD